MRAIDADAFKEYITSACEDMKYLFNDGGAVAKLITESFCKDIDEQPTVSAEPHWIPVTERLPEADGYGHYFLVCLENGVVRINGFSCIHTTRCPDGFYYETEHFTWRQNQNKVVAWMPLPEPYKGVTT